ncbi:MAG: hypothetical protein Q8M08_11860 [Bacteroidales bacterium]|nr:hypothetical protein [Bacteroidales bacterium]
MEEMKNYQEAKEEGKKVWAALTSQLGEGAGFFSAMFSSIKRFLINHLLYLVIFGVVFGALGCLFALLQKATIQAEMTVSYAQLEKKIYADMLYKLEQLRGSGQYKSLASALGIPEKAARKIHHINSRNIHNEPLVKDVSTEKVPFYIIVEVYDETVLPDLQKALVQYINEPPFVKERLKLTEQNYLTEIRLLQSQLGYLDSLKTLLLRTHKNSDTDAVGSLNTLNKSQNEIFARIRDLQGALQFNQNIEVMDGFVGHQMPLAQKCLPYLLIGMAIGVGIRLGWISFRQ